MFGRGWSICFHLFWSTGLGSWFARRFSWSSVRNVHRSDSFSSSTDRRRDPPYFFRTTLSRSGCQLLLYNRVSRSVRCDYWTFFGYSLGYLGGRFLIEKYGRFIGVTWREIEKAERKLTESGMRSLSYFSHGQFWYFLYLPYLLVRVSFDLV